MTDRQLVGVAGAFAVFLTACDQLFHVRTGTLAYHWHPQVGGQTVIVPITFFLGGMAMLDLTRRVRPKGGGKGRTAASLAGVTLAYLVSGMLDLDLAPAYAAVLLALWGIRVAARQDRPASIAVGLVIGVGGVLAEAALSAAGEFDYLAPDVLGVPWWLFPLYLHGALAAADVVALAGSRSSRTASEVSVTGRS